MKRKRIWQVLGLYALLLLGCAAMIFWNARAYHQVTVIESREEAERRADIPPPVRIEFQDTYLGHGIIDQEERSHALTNYTRRPCAKTHQRPCLLWRMMPV